MQIFSRSVFPRLALRFGIAFVLVFTSAIAAAGEFRVTPIRLDFTSETKSGAITVINEGKDRINLQISVMTWSQDEQGKDVYADTREIVFFPKIMTLEPGEQRVVRAGTKGPQPAEERTYRLFIQEIPDPASGRRRTQVSILIRFAPPLFVLPVKETVSGVLEKVEFSRGVLKAVVKNTGNVHFTITGVSFRGKSRDGKQVLAKDISGWYLLHGAARAYEVTPDASLCESLANADVEVKTESFTLSRTIDVLPGMCKP